MLIRKVMQHVRAPDKPLETHVRVAQRLRRVLRRLEWTVLRRLDGLLQGDYRTLFRGFGLDLADLREYQYHDDVRHIDWNVTARLQTPYVREFNEDREVAAWFLLDLSPVGRLRLRRACSKRAVSSEFVAVLARLLTRHGNRVGALFYGDEVDTVIPARSGRRHVLHLLHRDADAAGARAGAAPTDLDDLLRTALDVDQAALARLRRVRLHQPRPAGREPLAQLAQRHEVVAVRLYDPLEMELPDLGLLVDAGCRDRRAAVRRHPRPRLPQALRRAGRRSARRSCARRSARAGVDALELATDDDLRRCDPALRRPAQAAQPARGGRRHAAAHGPA